MLRGVVKGVMKRLSPLQCLSLHCSTHYISKLILIINDRQLYDNKTICPEREDQIQFFRRVNVIYTVEQPPMLERNLTLNPWIDASKPRSEFFFNLANTVRAPVLLQVSGLERDLFLSSYLNDPATHPPLARLRIICKLIPQWPIDLEFRRFPSTPKQPPITLQDVLVAVHRDVHRPITHLDWARLNPHKQRTITKWYNQRCGMNENEKAQGVKRVDYLNGKTRMVGLLRNGVEDGREVMSLILTDW